jgi:membrane fusion protein, multidrug efflux system
MTAGFEDRFTGGLAGTVLAADTAEVTFETRGRLVEVSVRPGDRVQPGMPLAAIEPVDLREQLVSAEAAVQTARSGLSKAQTDLRLARQRPAEKEKLEASEKEQETARARLLEAEAEMRRLRGQSYRQVQRARSEGWVAARLLEPGAIVEPGQPVLRLRSGDRYLLRFGVPPAEAAQWAGKKIRWRPEGSESSYPAVVARVAAQVDQASQLIFVEADLEPSPLLEDGLVVRVWPWTD